MADEPKTPESDEDLDLADPAVQPEGKFRDEGDALAPDGEGEEEEVLTFGDTDEEEQDTDNATIRHLRSRLKDVQKENSELRRVIPASQPIEVGPEPSLWDDGIDGDEQKLKAALREHDREVERAERQKNAGQEQAEAQRKALETRLSRFSEQKAALGRPDADEAVETVRAALGEAKFTGIIGLLDDTTDSAKFMVALAKSPHHLESLSGQTDAIRLLKEVTRLEGQLKMVKRRKVIEPDTPERGSGKTSVQTGSVRKELERLEKEAEKNGGDRSAVAAFKKKHGIRD